MANILPSVLIQNSVFWTWSTADSSELGKAHLMLTEKQQALWEDISYSAWAYSTTGSQSVPFLPSYSLWVQNTESIFTIKQILLFTPAPTGFSIKHFHLQRHWWCFPTLSLSYPSTVYQMFFWQISLRQIPSKQNWISAHTGQNTEVTLLYLYLNSLWWQLIPFSTFRSTREDTYMISKHDQ